MTDSGGRRRPVEFFDNETSEHFGMCANEARRSDPEVKRLVREALIERRDVIAELAPHIEAMMEIVRRVPYGDADWWAGGKLDDRVLSRVRDLSAQFGQWSDRFEEGYPTETYVENLSAFELGREIARRKLR